MSWRSPVAPHSSTSWPPAAAYARIAVSTERQCLRSDGDSTHSVRRVHAASRETPEAMALGTLAPPAMDKFVIEGGVPLSGTVLPAGNKNGALPILAASILTEEEVVIRNVPRIRDVQTMLELLEHLGVDVTWQGPNEVSLCAKDVNPSGEVDPVL